jgi:hypothetical protein
LVLACDDHDDDELVVEEVDDVSDKESEVGEYVERNGKSMELGEDRVMCTMKKNGSWMKTQRRV